MFFLVRPTNKYILKILNFDFEQSFIGRVIGGLFILLIIPIYSWLPIIISIGLSKTIEIMMKFWDISINFKELFAVIAASLFLLNYFFIWWIFKYHDYRNESVLNKEFLKRKDKLIYLDLKSLEQKRREYEYWIEVIKHISHLLRNKKIYDSEKWYIEIKKYKLTIRYYKQAYHTMHLQQQQS